MPVHEPTMYTVFPDGYEESKLNDKDRWCVYVERRMQPDGEYRWRVSDWPSGRGDVYTCTGKRIFDTRLQFRWTRFDTFEEALKVAYKVVNTSGVLGLTLEEAWANVQRRREEAST